MEKPYIEIRRVVIRCLNCGQHLVEKIARLDKNQTELYKYKEPLINLTDKKKKC